MHATSAMLKQIKEISADEYPATNLVKNHNRFLNILKKTLIFDQSEKEKAYLSSIC